MHQPTNPSFFPLTLVSSFSQPRDETDNCRPFQIVFLTQAGRSIRTTEKAKSSWEQLFTPSLCSFVPPLPSAAFGSESALVLSAVTVCHGANRFLLTGVSGRQVWVFHYFLYQVGIIWVWIGLFVPLCWCRNVHGFACIAEIRYLLHFIVTHYLFLPLSDILTLYQTIYIYTFLRCYCCFLESLVSKYKVWSMITFSFNILDLSLDCWPWSNVFRYYSRGLL